MPSGPVSIDVKDVLVSAGVGVFAAVTGWSINIGTEPVSPDTAITVYDTGGADPDPKWLLEFPTFQVRIRGSEGGYVLAYTKAKEIKDALLGFPTQVVNNTVYAGIWAVSDITHIGADQERPIFVINFRTAREPDSGTYRTTL